MFAKLACILVVHGQLQTQLEPWGSDSIRIRVAPPGQKITDSVLMPLAPRPTEGITATSSLTNGNLQVDIDDSGFITATRVSDGRILAKTTSLKFSPSSSPGVRAGSTSVFWEYAIDSTDRFYGLGEHRVGTINLNSFTKRFSDSQRYPNSFGSDVTIPWYSSSRGYGVLWNTASLGEVSINSTTQRASWSSVACLNLDVWLTTTDAATSLKNPFPDLLSHYTAAVGRAAKMPSWTTGFIQCKDRYRDQQQLLDVARGYVSRSLPISTIVIDWFHWVQQGDWSFNPKCWPDPKGMVDQLKAMGIEVMVTFWPFQQNATTHTKEFLDNKYVTAALNGSITPFGGANYLVDSTNPAARKATFDAWFEGYGQFGIRSVWLDATEPERWDDTFGLVRMAAGTDAEVGAAWSREWVRGWAEGMASKKVASDEFFLLARSAWAGTSSFSAGLWSGDITSTFAELELQIKAGQGVAMSGVALWTTDIGGYGQGDPQKPEFQDLIVRWFQFGAFCPLFRLHGHRDGGPPANDCGATNGDNEVWNLAPEPSRYNAIATVMKLRESLRSYVADINLMSATTGLPMMRPMFLEFPEDPNCATPQVEDQFMFGPTWLVAPVYKYKATTRSVYLPSLPTGQAWEYYYDQSQVFRGGARVDIATPITEFPLFRRIST